jgi:hypothetical protein
MCAGGRESRRQRIGYVPQELAFYKEMTTYDMAAFYARLKRVPAAGRIRPCWNRLGWRTSRQAGRRAFRRHEAAAGAGVGPAGRPARAGDGRADLQPRHGGAQPTAALLVQVKQAGKTIIFTSHRIEESNCWPTGRRHGAGRLLFRCPARVGRPRLGLRTQVKSACARPSARPGGGMCPAQRRLWRRAATASASSSMCARREGAPDPHAAPRQHRRSRF